MYRKRYASQLREYEVEVAQDAFACIACAKIEQMLQEVGETNRSSINQRMLPKPDYGLPFSFQNKLRCKIAR